MSIQWNCSSCSHWNAVAIDRCTHCGFQWKGDFDKVSHRSETRPAQLGLRSQGKQTQRRLPSHKNKDDRRW